jgi:glycosyltransferase
MTLKISIITVVRNGREFIEQTIKSVLSQHYRHIEYIVVDGGSTDGTDGVIKLYSGRISKWVSESDTGIADAFNKGLALSTGDYVLFLNSDDYLASPDVIGRMVQSIIETGCPELIYGDCNLVDRLTGRHLYTASIDFSLRAFKSGRTLPHPSLFTSRGYFDQHGKFDTQFRIAMDYEFLLRGALQSRVVHVPFVVTHVRTGGISTRSPVVAAEIVRALKKNQVIRTSFGAFAMLGYFRIRALLRGIKETLFPTRSAQG